MESKFLKVFGYWAIGLLLTVATLLIVHWTRNSVPWNKLDSGWVQAVGSVVAILVSFFFFRRQREHEHQQARDDGLLRRLLAMQTVSDVAFRALEAIERLAEKYECQFTPGITPDLMHRLPELRAILDRFAEPTADRIVVLVALTFSTALAETQDDIGVYNTNLTDHIVDRLRTRINELLAMQGRLIEQLHKLEERCRARGIDPEYKEELFSGG